MLLVGQHNAFMLTFNNKFIPDGDDDSFCKLGVFVAVEQMVKYRPIIR